MRKELEEILKREFTNRTIHKGITQDGKTHDEAIRTTLEAVGETLTAALDYMSRELDRITNEDSYLELDRDTEESRKRIKDREENPFVEK